MKKRYHVVPGNILPVPAREERDCPTCKGECFEVGSAGQLRQCPACGGSGREERAIDECPTCGANIGFDGTCPACETNEYDEHQATIALLTEALQMAIGDIAQREADVEEIRQELQAVDSEFVGDYEMERVENALYIAKHDRLKDGDPFELFNDDMAQQLKRILE